VTGNYAYVTYELDEGSGLQVVDVSNPAGPTGLGTWSTLGQTVGVAAVGNYAYIAHYNSSSIVNAIDRGKDQVTLERNRVVFES
jgi:hypothetical protein